MRTEERNFGPRTDVFSRKLPYFCERIILRPHFDTKTSN